MIMLKCWYNLELLPVTDVMTLFQITNVINQGTEQPCSSRQKKRAFLSQRSLSKKLGKTP